ncbi:hypothetical protein MTO96_021286 [Rhipicephalus appendiculatus]
MPLCATRARRLDVMLCFRGMALSVFTRGTLMKLSCGPQYLEYGCVAAEVSRRSLCGQTNRTESLCLDCVVLGAPWLPRGSGARSRRGNPVCLTVEVLGLDRESSPRDAKIEGASWPGVVTGYVTCCANRNVLWFRRSEACACSPVACTLRQPSQINFVQVPGSVPLALRNVLKSVHASHARDATHTSAEAAA